MLNPEHIRNASFSLLPTGYSPEEVDAALDKVAQAVASGDAIPDLVAARSFQLTGVGYAPAEVDAFFGTLMDRSSSDPLAESDAVATAAQHEPAAQVDLATTDGADSAAASDAATQEADGSRPELEVDREDASEAEHTREPQAELEREPAADARDELESFAEVVFAAAPANGRWQPPSEDMLELELLRQAVDRTGDTLASLRGFIDNEVGAMKLAVERQAHETAKRCECLVAEALAEANRVTAAVNTEISRAKKATDSAIEKQRRELHKELKQLRAACDAEITDARRQAEQYAANVRAEADKDRAEAQRTIEHAIGMQASIAESLERARQQLTPAQEQQSKAA